MEIGKRLNTLPDTFTLVITVAAVSLRIMAAINRVCQNNMTSQWTRPAASPRIPTSDGSCRNDGYIGLYSLTLTQLTVQCSSLSIVELAMRLRWLDTALSHPSSLIHFASALVLILRIVLPKAPESPIPRQWMLYPPTGGAVVHCCPSGFLSYIHKHLLLSWFVLSKRCSCIVFGFPCSFPQPLALPHHSTSLDVESRFAPLSVPSDSLQ